MVGGDARPQSDWAKLKQYLRALRYGGGSLVRQARQPVRTIEYSCCQEVLVVGGDARPQSNWAKLKRYLRALRLWWRLSGQANAVLILTSTGLPMARNSGTTFQLCLVRCLLSFLPAPIVRK